MILLWIALLIIGVVTFAYRASFIFFLEQLQLSTWLQQALRFVPVAALTAITVPELLVRNGVIAVGWQNERLVAGIMAACVAWWTKNIVLTLVIGMGALYLLQWMSRILSGSF